MRIGFVTVHVKDLERSLAFWREVMGLEIERRFAGGPGVEIAFLRDGGGHRLELIAGTGHAVHGEGFSVGFDVDEVDETLAHLRRCGVEITFGPKTMPSGVRLLQARDGDGLALVFVQNPA
jgi:lactoylglutathione lyase